MAASVTYTVFAGEIVHENRGGVERDYMPDPLGSTAALLDSSQTMTDTWVYWPYGEVKSKTGSNATPFGFVGTLGYYKDAVKSIYVRARYLRPDLGRWHTVDPLWPRLDSYVYSLNSPTLFTDPTGLLVAALPIVVGGVVITAAVAALLCILLGITLALLLWYLLTEGWKWLKEKWHQLCRYIRYMTKQACNNLPPSCACNDSCQSLFYKGLLYKACADWRNIETLVCYFGKSDPGHLLQELNMQFQYAQCLLIFVGIGCSSAVPPANPWWRFW